MLSKIGKIESLKSLINTDIIILGFFVSSFIAFGYAFKYNEVLIGFSQSVVQGTTPATASYAVSGHNKIQSLVGFVMGWVGIIILSLNSSIKKYIFITVIYFAVLGILVFPFQHEIRTPVLHESVVIPNSIKVFAGQLAGGALLGIVLYFIESLGQLLSLIGFFFLVGIKVGFVTWINGLKLAAGLDGSFSSAIIIALFLAIISYIAYRIVFYGVINIIFEYLGLSFIQCFTSGSTLASFYSIAVDGVAPYMFFSNIRADPILHPLIFKVFVLSILISTILTIIKSQTRFSKFSRTTN